ncbi:MAG: SGNH/GDSL hydrolase family protein, partial [Clostridia bacterium]
MHFDEVQIWGDSILKGVVYDQVRKRYVLLKECAVKVLSERLMVPISNHSQMGRTAPQGLEALKAAQGDLANKLVVLEYGGNDCDFDWASVAERPADEHLCHTPSEVFSYTLEQLVNLVRRRGGTPALCTLPPLNAQRYLDWITRNGLSRENILSYIGVADRIYRWQEYYSSLVQRAAYQMRCICLPMRDAFLENVRGEDVLCLDGIHPNNL